MNTTRRFCFLNFSAITQLFVPIVLLAMATSASADTNTFDTAASLNGWVHWWGGINETREFDPNMDADNNPSSGSMRVRAQFSRSLGGDNQFSMWGSFSGTPNSWTARLDGSQYARLEMDVLWDAFSPKIPATGNYSSDFHYGFAVGDPVYGQIDFQNHLNITPADADHWIHLSANIDPVTIGTNITNIVGIWIKMWTGNDPQNSLEDGEALFWVDNIKLIPLPPPPPPTPDYTNHFDTVESLGGWAHWWGGATETRTFDPTMDANGNPNSGSMKVEVPYNQSLGGDNQFSMWGSFSGTPNSWGVPLNGTLYTNLEMDIYWDPASPTRPATGDYGNDFRYGFAVGQPIYGQISFNNHTTITPGDVGHWFHISSPIDPVATGQNITNIVGVWLKMWTGANGTNSLSNGTTTFWVDNIRLGSKSTNAPPVPAPTMSIERPIPGLRLFASSPGSQYQRQGIRTRNPDYSWVGAANPVTYSLTIKAHPLLDGFQTHIFLVPGASVPASQTSPDYSEPNVVFLDIKGNTNGSGYATFRYKTNELGGNSFLYGAGSIATVGSASVVGTWSMTFDPNGTITVTPPSGTATNFMMPSDAVSLFSGPLFAYFGIQPNNTSYIGESATLSRVQITGVANPIDDTFPTSALDASVWEVVAESAIGVVPVPPEALFWLRWTVPDIGYHLQTTFAFPSGWADLALSSNQIGPRKRVLVLPTSLPESSSGNYFFRLSK